MAPKPPNSSPDSETSDKKARREKKRYYQQAKAWQDSGPLATVVNATKISSKVCNGRDQKDASEAICYNYNKKRYFAKNYFKPQKDRGISKN